MQDTSQPNGEITLTQQYKPKTDSNIEDSLASVAQSKGTAKVNQAKEEADSSPEKASGPREKKVPTSPKQKEEKVQTNVKDMVGHRRYVLELYGQRYQAEKSQSQAASSKKVVARFQDM